MARPRRETKQLFYDQFCDFEVADQAIVLELLQEFHRQKKRLARAVPSKTDAVASAASSQGSLLDDPATESSDGGSREIDVSTLDREPGTNMLRIPKEPHG